MSKTTLISLRLPIELKAALQAIAKREERPLSHVIVRALKSRYYSVKPKTKAKG